MNTTASSSRRATFSQVSAVLQSAPFPSSAARLPLELIEHILHLSAVSNRSEYYAALLPAQPWRYTSHPPLSSSHLAKLCLVSQGFNDAFTRVLYRSVVLDTDRAMAAFAETVSQSPRHGQFVRHLAIVPRHDMRAKPKLFGESRGSEAAIVADGILGRCPNATHLLLSRSQFDDWSPGLYSLTSAREVTLIGVVRASELDGLVSRHRQTVTAALQNNPTIQALLNSSTRTGPAPGEFLDGNDQGRGGGGQSDESVGDTSGSSREDVAASTSRSSFSGTGIGAGTSDSRPGRPRPMGRLPLTHLHLVNFDGRLIHHLAQLTSLTHVVLSYPRSVIERGVGAEAEGPVLPRSHLLLLLGSGRIRRIVVRASPATCQQILEEIVPIRDEKLILRPIRLKSAGQRSRARGHPSAAAAANHASSGSSGGSSTGRRGVQEVDVLAEWWERIHLDAMKHRRGDHATAWASSGSSRDRGDSLSSSEMEGDSSLSDDLDRIPGDGDGGGNVFGSGSGSGSDGSGSASRPGSYDSDVYSDDEADYEYENFQAWPPPPNTLHGHLFPGAFQQQHQQQPAPSFVPMPAAALEGRPLAAFGRPTSAATTGQPMPAPAAPPPQIPIEMLLAYEDLEQARQRRDAALMVPTVRSRSASRSDEERRQIRPGAYAARRSDVRGATETGIDRLAEVLAREAERLGAARSGRLG